MTAVRRSVFIAIMLAAAVSSTVFAATFFENFSTMPAGRCLPDGTVIGAWKFIYNGFGCNAFVKVNSNTVLFEQPQASAGPEESHAALVLGPATVGDFTMEVSAATTRQLRAGAPNPWEVAWVLWDYADNTHFYYFMAKRNGWELGKEDPAYPGAQRFLATGSAPAFPIGNWYKITVAQTGGTVTVSVNDRVIASVQDQERPYSSGNIGLYSEDAEAYFDNVAITTPDASHPGKGKKKPSGDRLDR